MIDLEAALGQFAHQAAQGEGTVPHTPIQKRRIFARDRPGLAPAHLARRQAHVSRNRRTQLITVLGATPNRAADGVVTRTKFGPREDWKSQLAFRLR
jgi:hypothetical protein